MNVTVQFLYNKLDSDLSEILKTILSKLHSLTSLHTCKYPGQHAVEGTANLNLSLVHDMMLVPWVLQMTRVFLITNAILDIQSMTAWLAGCCKCYAHNAGIEISSIPCHPDTHDAMLASVSYCEPGQVGYHPNCTVQVLMDTKVWCFLCIPTLQIPGCTVVTLSACTCNSVHDVVSQDVHVMTQSVHVW